MAKGFAMTLCFSEVWTPPRRPEVDMVFAYLDGEIIYHIERPKDDGMASWIMVTRDEKRLVVGVDLAAAKKMSARHQQRLWQRGARNFKRMFKAA